VADSSLTGDGPHAQRPDALDVDDLEGGIEERPPQVAVVVGPAMLSWGDGRPPKS